VTEMDAETRAAFIAKRKGRNRALALVLLGLAILFFFITIARMGTA
jgi:hypothetical protein